MPVSFGIKTSQQHTSYARIREIWQAADEIEEIEHAWLFDHFNPIGGPPVGPCLEAWTLLGALAGITRRLRMGTMVTGNTYRQPAVLAHMVATVDVISGGRLDFGFGAGWNEYEHQSMDIPLPPPGERVRRWGEACALIKTLMDAEPEAAVDFEGQYYRLREARLDPPPVQRPHPPFVLGARGERIGLRVVAEHADIWNHTAGDIDDLRHLLGVLHRHCAAIGRDPAQITVSVQPRVVSDLDAVRDEVADWIAAGAGHVVLILGRDMGPAILPDLVERVIRPLREASPGSGVR